jgi:phage/plasmid-like protein (TIGR03299 family)
MSHGIKEFDKGLVGFTKSLGKTWHGLEQFKHMDNAVPYEQAEAVADYEVVKMPLQTVTGIQLEDSFCLYRPDIEKVIYNFVGAQYHVAQNAEIIKFVEVGILQKYSNIAIESVITLNNGQGFALNLIVDKRVVKGDVSPTATRISIFNFHGGKALSVSIHTVRVVCMNTMRFAMTQAKSKGTFDSIRHTVNAGEKIENAVVDLGHIYGEIEANFEKLDAMADTKINEVKFDMFLTNVFGSGKITTKKDGEIKPNIIEDKKNEVKELYESKSDLKALDNNVYRAFNAVTDWADHEMKLRGDDKENQGTQFMSNIFAGGTSDKIKQKAFNVAFDMVLA